jgi:hypothetical protein
VYLGFAAGRNRNSEEERSHSGLQEREKKLFYPQKPLQKQEKQNNGFCEAGFPERTRTNAGRNREVEVCSSSSKPRKSMAEKLLTSPIAHLS